MAKEARLVAKYRLRMILEMGGPSLMCPKNVLAMGAPAVGLPMDWSARKVAGYHTPVSGLPRELE